jgi:hypothetical protein
MMSSLLKRLCLWIVRHGNGLTVDELAALVEPVPLTRLWIGRVNPHWEKKVLEESVIECRLASNIGQGRRLLMTEETALPHSLHASRKPERHKILRSKEYVFLINCICFISWRF